MARTLVSARTLQLHVLVRHERPDWIAYGLDFDVAAHGRTAVEAEQGIRDAIRLLVSDALAHDLLDDVFSSAPRDLWDAFVRTPVRPCRRSSPLRVEPVSVQLDERVIGAA